MSPRNVAIAALTALLLTGCAADTGPEPDPVAPTETQGDMQPTEAAPSEPDFEPVPVSTECQAAFAEMGQAYDTAADDADLDALELPALTACTTAAEWLSAAQENPEAAGLTSPEDVDRWTLQARCRESFPEGRATPACQDGIATGIVE